MPRWGRVKHWPLVLQLPKASGGKASASTALAPQRPEIGGAAQQPTPQTCSVQSVHREAQFQGGTRDRG